VEGRFKRKQVPCLSEIYINPSFGSELERRFLPSLKALGGQMDLDDARFPPVQITQDVKAGKTAYLLTVGGNKYWVDTQVPIEDLASGQTLCQPDFLISTTKTASPMVPIAVFVDGWEHHQKSMPDDARKRATLMLRGDYRVWSVTFEDIEAAHKLRGGTDLESPLSVLMTESGQKIPADRIPQIPLSDLTSNAIALLLRLLGQPQSLDQDPLHRLRPTGQHLLMRTVLRSQEVSDAVRTRSDAVLESLPEWLWHDAHAVHLHSPGKGAVQWVGKAEPKFLTGKSTLEYPLAGALIVDDLAIAENPKQGRSHWRQWLRLVNLLQAVPGVALSTQAMLDAGETLMVLRPQVDRPTAVSADWNQILDDAAFLERLKQGFVHLGNSGVPAPDAIGVEFEENNDYRLAEALWEQARVVFLSSAQVECAQSWKSAGYAVIEEDENWWLEVESALKGQQS
jgi:DEAD/DEAH box helicase domain-containing protein